MYTIGPNNYDRNSIIPWCNKYMFVIGFSFFFPFFLITSFIAFADFGSCSGNPFRDNKMELQP